jgi:hypothetical protein
MATLEISLRHARNAYNIIRDMRYLQNFITWTSTTTLVISDEELAMDLIEELERLEIEVECNY